MIGGGEEEDGRSENETNKNVAAQERTNERESSFVAHLCPLFSAPLLWYENLLYSSSIGDVRLSFFRSFDREKKREKKRELFYVLPNEIIKP